MVSGRFKTYLLISFYFSRNNYLIKAKGILFEIFYQLILKSDSLI